MADAVASMKPIVLVVCFLSLGVRTGLVVALSIPLVLAMTFALYAMRAARRDRWTPAGWLFGIGIVLVMRGWRITLGSTNDSASHAFIGRNSTIVRPCLIRMPTDTA